MIAVLAALVVKGSVLMIAAAGVVALMQRASAAARHFVWTLTVVGLLALPVFAALLPMWSIAVPIKPAATRTPPDAARPISIAADAPSSESASTTTGTTILADGNDLPWAMLPAAIYVVAVLVLLGRLAVERSAAQRIVREAVLVSDPEWASELSECAVRTGISRAVALRRSRVQLMPMTTGTLAPAIVIPADADTWDESRRRAVLLHELAHIARRDCLTQMLSAIACAVYWFHPGAWYVARRLRIERELACDDRVLAAGAGASDYASHLLELAYTWSGRRAPALAVGMTSSRKLEGRMRAVLDPSRNRTAPSRRVAVVGAAVAAALLLPLAALTMTAVSGDVQPLGDGPDAQAGRDQERSTVALDATSGTWELRPSRTPNRVWLRLSVGDSSFSSDVDASELERVSREPLSRINGPVRYSLPREAGTFEIEGTIRAGAGSGSFRFVPSEAFVTRLTARGFERPTAAQSMALAQHDLGFAFIDELAAQKYAQPVTSELVRAAHHGVDLDFVRGMGEAGYRVGTLETLIRFRDHGVSPEYVRELRAEGLSGLAPEDLVRVRDHGVDAAYVRALSDLGYRSMSFDMLVRARDHGVTPDYVSVLRDLGYSSLALEDVIRARDHGVDSRYLRDMRELGYKLALPDLIKARDHGVTPDYIVALAVLGYKTIPIEDLIRMRDHGVTPEFVVETQKQRGTGRRSVDELIRLRDRGVASHSSHVNYILARVWDTLATEVDDAIRKLKRKLA